MKRLRGTAFDPFGYTAERRLERRLIADYRALVSRSVERLNHANLPIAIELAGTAAQIGGYGPVKLDSVKAYEARLSVLLEGFERTATPVATRAA